MRRQRRERYLHAWEVFDFRLGCRWRASDLAVEAIVSLGTKDCASGTFVTEAPYCDIFSAGFPCQPFSCAGKNLGAEDQRCVHTQLLKYICRVQPRVVILENVGGLVRGKHLNTMLDIIGKLESIIDPNTRRKCYQVQYALINAIRFLPQVRKRLYIVCIKLFGRASVGFAWPRRAKKPVKLEDIFDEGPVLDNYNAHPYPDSRLGKQHVQLVLNQITEFCKAKNLDPLDIPVIIDLAGSHPNWQIHKSPCVTRTRGGQRACLVAPTRPAPHSL